MWAVCVKPTGFPIIFFRFSLSSFLFLLPKKLLFIISVFLIIFIFKFLAKPVGETENEDF